MGLSRPDGDPGNSRPDAASARRPVSLRSSSRPAALPAALRSRLPIPSLCGPERCIRRAARLRGETDAARRRKDHRGGPDRYHHPSGGPRHLVRRPASEAGVLPDRVGARGKFQHFRRLQAPGGLPRPYRGLPYAGEHVPDRACLP